jgi:GNAT superfamily N-acetyltransferase
LSDPLSTADPKLRLRFATEVDTGLIFDLIKALAKYERLSHEVVTDEETLRNTLFRGRKVAEVVIADYNNEPAGFALFFHNYSTFLGKPGLYLEDLFVKPEFRGNGIGRELLSCLARIAAERGCGRLEWWVLDWNDTAIRFYKSLGGQPMDEWTVFRLCGDSLTRLAEGNE